MAKINQESFIIFFNGRTPVTGKFLALILALEMMNFKQIWPFGFQHNSLIYAQIICLNDSFKFADIRF